MLSEKCSPYNPPICLEACYGEEKAHTCVIANFGGGRLENENKEIVKRYYAEVISGGDYSNLGSFVAAEYVDHNAEDSGRGPEIVRNHIEAIRTTLPDFNMRVEQIFAEGDWVATRVSGRGTHQGEWMNIRPTGREIRLKGINLDRLQDGKIVEHWGEADTVNMLLQMGLNPFASTQG